MDNTQMQESVKDENVKNDVVTETKELNTSNDSSNSNENKEEGTQLATTEKEEPKLELSHMDKDFIYDVMSVPSVSNGEYRMVTYIILWARRNNIKYEFDDYGNVYLTKGELSDGEFYPCVTAHLDTVQTKQEPYAQVGMSLNIKERISKDNKHEIYVDGMGIGGDDKAGVTICLSIFNHIDKLKACFFLQEEIGCKGSNQLMKEWFTNVGYVIGYDSPDLNRAAYACSGVKLFSKDFYNTYMKDVCTEYGLTTFRSEPFTDVKSIREKTNIMCMNFGTGYYGAHSATEYCVLEDMDHACAMGCALIEKIGNTEHKFEYKTYSYTKGANGEYKYDDDESFYRTLEGNTYSGYYTRGWAYGDDDYEDYYDSHYYGTYSSYNSGSKTVNNTNTSKETNNSSKTVENNNEKTVSIETLRYVTEKYEEYVADIKDGVKKKCEECGIDFAQFAEVFKNEIKF